MAIFSALAGIAGAVSAAAGVAGTVISFMGARKAAKASERAEALRERQMNLQASRDRRNTVRQAVVARAQAISNATAQNAGEGSGLAGGLGQISAQSGSNIQGINQGQEIGQGIFRANRDIAKGQGMQSLGQAIQGFGSFFSSNFEQNQRVYG